ncbi:SAP30-binding protein [Culicoides brevitarsis]|uniref:SAP30-binding protein n=1 Tax=Culicoides brevitarsis TaxID=469753 RepID=UPI00307B3594
MENSNSALASLTATYTDSEGEADDNKYDDDVIESRSDSHSTPASPAASTSTQSPKSTEPTSKKKKKTALRLVSYNDENDDEMMSPEHDEDEEESEDEQEEVAMDQQENEKPAEETELETQHVDLAKLYGFSLPPEPKAKCPAELQEKIAKSYEKMKTNNLDMNKIIQERKEFRNPSIYEKLISFCDINELGTNYPPEIYDPSHFGKESYYEELARIQKLEMDKLEKQKKEQVTIVTGSKKPTEVEKRKSKWDQPAPNVQVKPVPTQTGTKTTVLNAFGSLSKKPKV